MRPIADFQTLERTSLHTHTSDVLATATPIPVLW